MPEPVPAEAPTASMTTPTAGASEKSPRAGEVNRGPPEEAKPDEKPVKPTEDEAQKAKAEQTKLLARERMKLGHEARQQKEAAAKREQEFAAREAKLKEWEALRADRLRNPAKYLAQDYGEDWYTKLSKVQLEGGATPDLIASEMTSTAEAIRKEFRAEIDSLKAQLAEKDTQSVQQQKAEYESRAVEHAKTNAEKYPLIHAFDALPRIPHVIDDHFTQTSSYDSDGNFVPGEVLTPEQAAEMIEKWLDEKFSAASKAKQLKSAPKVPPVVERNNSQQRRTLSTDLTATSDGDLAPPKNEGERIKRAIAKWDAVANGNN